MSNLKTKYNGKSYKEADAFLGEENFKEVCYKTFMRRVNAKRWDGIIVKRIEIVHHKTAIVIYEAGQPTELNSGGYRSSTTKDRMCRFTKEGVYQKGWEWYTGNGNVFYDGIHVD